MSTSGLVSILLESRRLPANPPGAMMNKTVIPSLSLSRKASSRYLDPSPMATFISNLTRLSINVETETYS